MTTKTTDSPAPRAGFALMLGQALAGFGLLLLLGVQMRVFATVFDHDLVFLALGLALFGTGGGLALGHWLVPREDRKADGQRMAAGLVVAGLTASGGLVLLLSWPLGGVVPFLAIIAAFALPFAACGYGIAHVSRSSGYRGVLGAWSVAAILAALLTGRLIETVGDPLRAGWWATVVLGVAALAIAGRRIGAGLGAGLLMLGASGAYFLTGGFTLTPSWTEAGLAAARPLYAELRSGNLAVEPVTSWSGAQRSDALTYRGQEQDLRWLFTDATAPVPVVVGRDKSLDWLKARFPLLAVPLLANSPKSLLTIGAFPGPELALARALGVREVQALAYNGAARELLVRGGDLPESLAGDLVYSVDPRAAARADTAGVDQIILPVTHINKSGRVGATYQDRELYTLEAFGEYWQRLRPGGLLVVTTADEVLFVRTVLTVWAMLERQPVAEAGLPAQRSWGLRLAPSAEFQGPHQFVFMVAKGAVSTQLPVQLRQAYQGLPVEPLFGPGLAVAQSNLFGRSQQPAQSSPVESLLGSGFLATRHYAALFQLSGLSKAEEILTRVLSQQAGGWVSLSPATDQRPVFFKVLVELRPELKWLFTGVLLMLAACVLFALPSTRRHDVALAQPRPAVAVFLVYFALMGAAGAAMLVGLLGRSARLVGVSLETQAALLAAVLAGMAVAVPLARRLALARPAVIVPPLAAMLLAALLYAVTGPGYAASVASSAAAKWLLVAGCAVVGGAALAVLCAMALRHLEIMASAVVAWAWLVLGMAALSGVVLAEWWATAWGWNLVWGVLGGVYGVIAVAGFWLWNRPEIQGAPLTAKAVHAA